MSVIRVGTIGLLLALCASSPARAYAQQALPSGVTLSSVSTRHAMPAPASDARTGTIVRYTLGGAAIGGVVGVVLSFLEGLQGQDCVEGRCIGGDTHLVRNVGLGAAIGAFWGALSGLAAVNDR